MNSPSRYDAIIVGGGHNGLITAGLLARRGFKVLVLERRDIVGGAAVTEMPWGPDFKVTSLSYVVSLLPPTVLKELSLEKYGYLVYPQHGYFVPYGDGRYLQLKDDMKEKQAEIAKFSPKDAERYPAWDAWLGQVAHVLGPMLSMVPPRLGSKSFGDLMATADLAWRFRKLSVQQVGDVTKLMTSSIADLVEDFFESEQMRAVLAVSGVIGTWAGPRSAGTAYVMAHHKLGDIGQGQMGAWGFPRGGMGAVTHAMREAAEANGAIVKTGAAVSKITTKNGRAHSVVLENGDEFVSDVVVAACHPAKTFLSFIDRADLPPDFVRGIETWKSRSGTVKINLALDRLPEFKAKPGFDPTVHGGTIVLADSLDDIEGAYQDAVAGRAAQKPFADICIPSVFDKSLAPEGKHVMSMFTQWVGVSGPKAPHTDELNAYADRVIARVEAVAPGFASSILHRQVIGPYDMENTYGLVGGSIWHGELSVSQMFHMRPVPGYADYRTPIEGLYHASSATHGGGGVTGLPALQVVERIVADR